MLEYSNLFVLAGSPVIDSPDQDTAGLAKHYSIKSRMMVWPALLNVDVDFTFFRSLNGTQFGGFPCLPGRAFSASSGVRAQMR